MKKVITHYSRYGYEGNYIYNSVCGKQVKTHQDNEGSTIHPDKATCFNCLLQNEYKIDLAHFKSTPNDTKRRIYIESDILHADELRDAARSAYEYAKENNLKCVDRVFSDVLDYAWHNLKKTWEAVKLADEIWATSSLMPLSGSSYIGAPVIFNEMCKRAIAENIEGKSVIILNSLRNIYWSMIDIDIMKKAFTKNSLLMYDENYDLSKIDVSEINKTK